ncbi:MAG: hypothetical protein U9Q80_11030 [Bacillota bacterium]|nr:hypothetical protein [Bacillota bacterium]
MNKGWQIALVVILVIVGFIGSAYLMRAVGELSIEIDALKTVVDNQENEVSKQNEVILGLEEDNQYLNENIGLLLDDNNELNEDMIFLKEKFIELPGVVMKFGAIKKMIVANGYVEFEIDQKEWLSGEEAMRFLIDEYDLEIDQAKDLMPNNFYVNDISDDNKVYKLPKEAIINLFEENELKIGDLITLAAHVNDNKSLLNYPLFHFYVIESSVVEVTEQYIP